MVFLLFDDIVHLFRHKRRTNYRRLWTQREVYQEVKATLKQQTSTDGESITENYGIFLKRKGIGAKEVMFGKPDNQNVCTYR